MSHPTSLRLPDPVKDRLDDSAVRRGESSSALAVRLIDEGLRMQAHPGVVFHDSPTQGRVACLSSGPDVAEVLDVLLGLEVQGDERVTETATWFAIHPSRVRVAVDYYTAHPDEVDRQRTLRRQVAAEARARYEAQQALLE